MPNPEEYLASLLTTPEQEAKNLRASRSKQRVLAFADALRHIGNIYTTTQGAPAMQFNDPVTAEGTRYKQDKLLRDANNMKYYTYQQAKKAQDIAMQKNQWEMLNGAAKLELEQKKFALQQEQAQARMAGDAAKVQEIQTRINRINALLPGEIEAQQAQIRQRNASAASSYASAAYTNDKRQNPDKYTSRSGGGMNGYTTTTEYTYDPTTGKTKSTTRKRIPTGGQSLLPSTGGALLPN